MGEIAEMMLDGTMCEGCGEFMDGDGPGFPRRCAGCRTSSSPRSQRRRIANTRVNPNPKTIKCGQCEKKFASDAARAQHLRDRHGVK